MEGLLVRRGPEFWTSLCDDKPVNREFFRFAMRCQFNRDVLEALPDEHPAWWSRERVDHLLSQITGGGPARGVLSSTLVILDRLSRDFDLNLDAHLTPNKGQIKGASGKASSKILARFGESRPFPVEGGRTNRGNIKTAESLLSPLAESGIGRLSKEERNLRPDQNH